MSTPPPLPTLLALLLIMISISLTLVTGRVLWLAAVKPWLILAAAIIAPTTVALIALSSTGILQVSVAVWLVIITSSEVIGDSSRRLPLLAVLILTLTLLLIGYFIFNQGLLVPTLVIWPSMASLVARRWFPPTDNLVHSSLDYKYLRLEILSLGLKQPVAAGIKRL